MVQMMAGRLLRQQGFNLRQFALTQTRSYAIPSFTPTSSSPELDEALDRVRKGLIIPFSLGEQQRRLVFRKKYAQRLEDNPVVLRLGGAQEEEEYALRPSGHPEAKITKKESLAVVRLFKTPEDWQNAAPLLAGLKKARMVLKQDQREWLVRRAAMAGALGSILECAKQADRTAFWLNEVGVVHRIFFALHVMAQEANFEPVATSKALSLAKQTSRLMDMPRHSVRDVELDPKHRPSVISVLLELSASQALNKFEGHDQTGDVLRYAERLLANWKYGNFRGTETDWPAIDYMLQHNVLIYNGMKLALQVQGIASNKSVSSMLKSRVNEIGTLIAKQTKEVPAKIQERPSMGYIQSKALYP
ncbi:hypothetical protein ASPZODRAFT_14567 [Penicilliopsis zonata CBS 506.65]|uniref:Uncharacterized protein n=1 Tax=Penicilliopsis zonata CBS 506.65 TaxID=1073090 RepID=A0A1L9SMW0_9EURO|nr:hypothetical protein ASPZODRAFT_14567 [Penicilliopsis zonata CBS 506.65]OJJ48431.1 hypothetical protein ASPZODRAFT_14567 [Penicilliopsis zonata CBS 506.65]